MQREYQQNITAESVVRAIEVHGEKAIVALSRHPELIARLGNILPSDLFQQHDTTLAEHTLSCDSSLRLAASIVDSYCFDNNSGISTCLIPAGIPDEQAIGALAHLAENLYPKRFSAEFMAENFSKLFDWPAEFSEYLLSPSLTKERAIVQICVIDSISDGKFKDSTIGKDRTEQSRILKKRQLDFSDPRDTITSVLAHACKHDGEMLLEGMNVRCSIPGWALTFINTCGVTFTRCFDDTGKNAAASGTPCRQIGPLNR